LHVARGGLGLISLADRATGGFLFSTIRILPMLVRRSASLSSDQQQVAWQWRLKHADVCIQDLAAQGIAICSNGEVQKLSDVNKMCLLKAKEISVLKPLKCKVGHRPFVSSFVLTESFSGASQRNQARIRALQNPIGGLILTMAPILHISEAQRCSMDNYDPSSFGIASLFGWTTLCACVQILAQGV
jgi:hypothetical protein